MRSFRVILLSALLFGAFAAEAQQAVPPVQLRRGDRTVVRGGMLEKPDTLTTEKRDSLQIAAFVQALDSLQHSDFAADSVELAALRTDDIRTLDSATLARLTAERTPAESTRKRSLKMRWSMNNSMSLSEVCSLSTVIPGY